MLIIRKNQANNLVVTVSLNKTLPSPNYLFSFQHIVSKEKVSFIPEPIVSNTRYDKFRFIESSIVNLSATTPSVYFQYEGQYYYSVYEQVSSTNTNPSLAYNKVEEGRAVVIIGDAQTDSYFYEPYISDNEDFANIIFISEQENLNTTPTPTSSNTPTTTSTPTNTPTTTSTPTNTPTNTSTPTTTPTTTSTPTPTPTTPALPFNSFIVGSGSTFSEACSNLSIGNTIQVWVDVSNPSSCNGCVPFNCFPCIDANNDTWWLDSSFTIPLPDMWLANYINPPLGNPSRQQIVNQLIVGATFTSC